MSVIELEGEPEVKVPGENGVQGGLTSEQLRNLQDPKIQEQYQEAYRLQQQRLSCPACGEYGVLF
jgi:hypothetical protein